MDNLVANILTADKKIKAVDGGVRETPLDESGVFGEQTGTTFLLKCEHLQRTGCFKLRGALNRVLALNEEEQKTGLLRRPQAITALPPPRPLSAVAWMPLFIYPIRYLPTNSQI